MLLSAYPISLSDGRLLNLTTHKLESGIKGGSMFEIVIRDTGEVILANSPFARALTARARRLEDCASIIGISINLFSSAFSSSVDSPFIS